MNDTETLLTTRHTTHGDFTMNALVAQGLKDIIHKASGINHFSAVQSEALDFICSKIGRLCSGKPNVKDHWDDIAGYATLAADRCTE